ncbi:FMN reductase [Nakamurella panacisegetis]|uniref:FMN reductase n=1 Tax=Nakamurella panacisegetis TaxID=1090615 RepID=A0A1H0NKP9_9ACTN|nr:NAD(P)H-dependent oxidoreductase [Nakamurella panacisegetis]SDO92995.1 FMN reductase [Nakamurella panacisegetis]
MTSVVTVVGNPKSGSRTLAAATALADAVAALVPAPCGQVIDLADIGTGLLAPWALSPEAAATVAAVRGADILILATPTYKASFTGLLKLLLDTLPAGSLDRAVVLPLTISAGPAHRHLADWQLRPVLGELGAVLAAPSLLLSESEFPNLTGAVETYVNANARLILAALAALRDESVSPRTPDR